MRILLDTCVLSEIRHPKGSAKVKAAVAALDEDSLFISAITIGELHKGIHALRKSKRKTELALWLTTLEQGYGDRILAIDTQVCALWGEMTAKGQSKGIQIGMADGLIAATAICNGLHVMTRNVSDFTPTGARIVNPWQDT